MSTELQYAAFLEFFFDLLQLFPYPEKLKLKCMIKGALHFTGCITYNAAIFLSFSAALNERIQTHTHTHL